MFVGTYLFFFFCVIRLFLFLTNYQTISNCSLVVVFSLLFCFDFLVLSLFAGFCSLLFALYHVIMHPLNTCFVTYAIRFRFKIVFCIYDYCVWTVLWIVCFASKVLKFDCWFPSPYRDCFIVWFAIAIYWFSVSPSSALLPINTHPFR